MGLRIQAGVKPMYNNENTHDFKIVLSIDEKIACLQEILLRVKKILYVYDKSQEPESKYDYKIYLGGIMIYISSSNNLFNGELVNILVNLNAIAENDFTKAQIKRIVFESRNQLESMIEKYQMEKQNAEKDG